MHSLCFSALLLIVESFRRVGKWIYISSSEAEVPPPFFVQYICGGAHTKTKPRNPKHVVMTSCPLEIYAMPSFLGSYHSNYCLLERTNKCALFYLMRATGWKQFFTFHLMALVMQLIRSRFGLYFFHIINHSHIHFTR